MSLTDRDLMLRVQAGEHALFAELVKRFRPRLLRFATSKLGDRTLAEDLVQETFLAAFVSRSTYNPTFAFSTWVWTILLNLCRSAGRSARETRWRRREGSGEALQNHPSPAPTGTENAEENREELQQWLSHLPEAEGDALRLRFFGELSFDEIASAMQSSVSGAKVRVRRGLERLAELARAAQDDTPAKGLVRGASGAGEREGEQT